MFHHRIHVLLDKLANQTEPQQPSSLDIWNTFVSGLRRDVQLHVRSMVAKPGDLEAALQAARARERQFHRESAPSRTHSAMGDADASYVPAHIRAGRGAISEGGIPRHHGAGFLALVG